MVQARWITGVQIAETARLGSSHGYALELFADDRLASGGWDKTVRLWDVKTSRKTLNAGSNSCWSAGCKS
jgi:WD40 repeat protein